MTWIFISHSSRDGPFAGGYLKAVLEGAGMTVWCSSKDMPCAADWEKQIHAALTRADWYVIVLSPDAAESDWVRAEAHWALEHRKGHVIPVMIRTCEPAAVHLKLGMLQFIDFRVDPEGATARLLALLRGEAGDPPSPKDEATLVIALGQELPCRARAVFAVSADPGHQIEVPIEIDRQCILGRAIESDLPIANPSVSRRHARLTLAVDPARKRLEINDLQSANGTYVNGERILAPHPLEVGDVIALGSARLRLLQLT